MHPIWFAFFGLWAVIELVQLARKKPMPSRLKAPAIITTIITSLYSYGLAGLASESATFATFLVYVAMYGGVAVLIYWVRAWIAKPACSKDQESKLKAL